MCTPGHPTPVPLERAWGLRASLSWGLPARSSQVPNHKEGQQWSRRRTKDGWLPPAEAVLGSQVLLRTALRDKASLAAATSLQLQRTRRTVCCEVLDTAHLQE